MTFSIIVVCLNAGVKVNQTIESILCQTEQDYEIIIKDGGSTDGSVEQLQQRLRDGWQADSADELQRDAQAGVWTHERIRIICQEDAGIYDAMNQALCYAKGDNIFFLNCGDCFADENVLRKVKETIRQNDAPVIYYGNILEQKTGTVVQSNPVLDDFACYRNLPCHQACFYGRRLFESRKFDTRYKVRADYEHFLWCLYEAHAHAVYMPFVVAAYEGGGFSESKAAKKQSKQEHREIVAKYLPGGQVLKYRIIMVVTLAPVRTWLTEHPATAKIYQRCKKVLYRIQVL